MLCLAHGLLKVAAEAVAQQLGIALEQGEQQRVELGNGERVALEGLDECLDGRLGGDVHLGLAAVAQGERDDVDDAAAHAVPQIIHLGLGAEAGGCGLDDVVLDEEESDHLLEQRRHRRIGGIEGKPLVEQQIRLRPPVLLIRRLELLAQVERIVDVDALVERPEIDRDRVVVDKVVLGAFVGDELDGRVELGEAQQRIALRLYAPSLLARLDGLERELADGARLFARLEEPLLHLARDGGLDLVAHLWDRVHHMLCKLVMQHRAQMHRLELLQTAQRGKVFLLPDQARRRGSPGRARADRCAAIRWPH